MDDRKLAHELETIELLVARARETVGKHDRRSFAEDRDAVDATAYRLAMIGEHCKRLPPDLQERHPNLPWRQMVGLRNIVSHAYDEIDTGIIWSAATARLDEIGRMCRDEKGRLDPEGSREGGA
ncbi:hypothetical protein HY78_19725 [Rhizorhabdus wittichii DC-6]|nr:hypothetical protein HY78_19725 [Rhizorhabdus wittichii DC-6]